MTCHRFPMPGDDGIAIIFNRAQRKPDQLCPCGHTATHLCDYPIASRKTCDAPLCKRCRFHVGKDSDMCPKHAAMWHGGSTEGL
jgi:hypothetical protein